MTATPEKPSPSPKTGKRRQWSPHFWVGCDFFAWLRLLLRHHFAVHWSCWYVAGVATVVSLCHTVLRLFQESWYSDRLERIRIRNAPLFIIGHWRTGTTLLHELLILDPRHSYATTYECLDPITSCSPSLC
jgi:hypothetical protein